MNHKWNGNVCTKCGLVRKRKTFKLLMAIEGSKNYYKYETGYLYWGVNIPSRMDRPECVKTKTETI